MINNPILMDSGVYVWEKYDISRPYIISETKSTAFGSKPDIPSDADTSVKYTEYELNSETGVFTLAEPNDNRHPYYLYSESPNKIYGIYDAGTHNSYVDVYKWETTTYEAVLGEQVKGSTCYGTVTSEDEAHIPLTGNRTDTGMCWLGKPVRRWDCTIASRILCNTNWRRCIHEAAH